MSVSKAAPVSEAAGASTSPPQPADPLKNPAYPQRVHIHERAHWQGVLRSCDDRVAAYWQKLNSLGAQAPDRARLERLHAQMVGARDQVADAARRLHGEVGALYEEDRHRLDEAVAALDRVARGWDGA